MEDADGVARALVAGLLGVVLALGFPLLAQGVEGSWQQIVLLSLGLACVVLLATGFILALVAQIVEGRGGRSSETLLLLCDVFLISAAGAGVVLAVFSFVFKVLVLAA